MKRSIIGVIDQILSLLERSEINLEINLEINSLDVLIYQLKDLRSTVIYSAPEIRLSNLHWMMLYDILTNYFPDDYCEREINPSLNVLKSIMCGYFEYESYNDLKNAIKANLYGYYSSETIRIGTEIIKIMEQYVVQIPRVASYDDLDGGILLFWIKDEGDSIQMRIIADRLIMKAKIAGTKFKTDNSVKLYTKSDGIMTDDMEYFLENIRILMKWNQ